MLKKRQTASGWLFLFCTQRYPFTGGPLVAWYFWECASVILWVRHVFLFFFQLFFVTIFFVFSFVDCLFFISCFKLVLSFEVHCSTFPWGHRSSLSFLGFLRQPPPLLFMLSHACCASGFVNSLKHSYSIGHLCTCLSPNVDRVLFCYIISGALSSTEPSKGNEWNGMKAARRKT